MGASASFSLTTRLADVFRRPFSHVAQLLLASLALIRGVRVSHTDMLDSCECDGCCCEAQMRLQTMFYIVNNRSVVIEYQRVDGDSFLQSVAVMSD